jgi:hypothetical protein
MNAMEPRLRPAYSKLAQLLGAVLFCAGLAAACGSGDDAEGGGEGGAGNGGAGNGGAMNVGGGVGARDGSADGKIDPDAACADETAGGELKPLAMYLLLDRSASMDQNDKWGDAASGLADFVDDPGTVGIKIAFGFFPNPNAQCNGTGYADPLVPMGLLPGNGAAVKNAMATTNFTSLGTPIEGALNGLRTFCAAYSQQNPAEEVVGVLITDGDPNGCSSRSSTLAGIAAQAYASDPPNRMFMVGMDGADFNLLNQIAAAGGGQQAFNVSSGGAQAFVAALKSIAGSALPCELGMPTSTKGPVDPAKINVLYTGQSGQEQMLGQVAEASQCVPNAWHYDDNASPTKIILCPGTCSAVQSEASGKIQIVLGCETIPPPPPR